MVDDMVNGSGDLMVGTPSGRKVGFHGGPDRRIRRLVKQHAQCNDLGRHCLFLEEHTLSNTVDTCRIADGIQNSS